jgi:superoxide dismutase, Fe-Mn family
MAILTPRTFPAFSQCPALSPFTLTSHLALYEGYVRKYNELSAQLTTVYNRGPITSSFDGESLKSDLTFALGAIKNHELYFDILGPETNDQPTGDLADALVSSFHSIPQYLADLRQTAQRARGWLFTAYDLDHGFLFNCDAAGQNGLPVWNATPILAIDLYGHAYFYDYGNNPQPYLEATLKCLHWPAIAQRLAHVTRASSPASAEGLPDPNPHAPGAQPTCP